MRFGRLAIIGITSVPWQYRQVSHDTCASAIGAIVLAIVSIGQAPHIFEVAQTAPLDSGKLRLQLMGQPLDDLGAPPLGALTEQDVTANRPVEQDQLPADR